MTQLNPQSEDIIQRLVRRAEDRMRESDGLNKVEPMDAVVVMLGILLWPPG